VGQPERKTLSSKFACVKGELPGAYPECRARQPLSWLDARQTVRQEIPVPPFPVLLGALSENKGFSRVPDFSPWQCEQEYPSRTAAG
jgi:hypothetical protein